MIPLLPGPEAIQRLNTLFADAPRIIHQPWRQQSDGSYAERKPHPAAFKKGATPKTVARFPEIIALMDSHTPSAIARQLGMNRSTVRNAVIQIKEQQNGIS